MGGPYKADSSDLWTAKNQYRIRESGNADNGQSLRMNARSHISGPAFYSVPGETKYNRRHMYNVQCIALKKPLFKYQNAAAADITTILLLLKTLCQPPSQCPSFILAVRRCYTFQPTSISFSDAYSVYR